MVFLVLSRVSGKFRTFDLSTFLKGSYGNRFCLYILGHIRQRTDWGGATVSHTLVHEVDTGCVNTRAKVAAKGEIYLLLKHRQKEGKGNFETGGNVTSSGGSFRCPRSWYKTPFDSSLASIDGGEGALCSQIINISSVNAWHFLKIQLGCF